MRTWIVAATFLAAAGAIAGEPVPRKRTQPPAQQPQAKAVEPTTEARVSPIEPDTVYDVATAARAARDYLLTIEDEERRFNTRVFSFYEFKDPAVREERIRTMNFAINSISRAGRLKLMDRVPGTKDALTAVDLRDFRIDPKFWEQFAKASRYYLADAIASEKQVTVQAVPTPAVVPEVRRVRKYTGYRPWPGGVWYADSKYYPPGSFQYQQWYDVDEVIERPAVVNQTVVAESTPVERKAVIANPTIDPTVAQHLVVLSGSVMPIAFAMEFMVQTTDTTKSTLYYDILGMGKSVKEAYKIIGADIDFVAKIEKDRQGMVAFSGITQKNRRLTRVPTVTGYLWLSTDSKTDTDRQNYFEILLDRGVDNFDATEQIFSLPNELQGYLLADNKDELQTSAPDFIAHDKMTTNNDGRVRNGLSCIRCHDTGILKFHSVFQDLRKSIKAYSYSADDLRRLDQLYGGHLDDEFAEDQARYARAVKRVANRTPQENARLYARAFADWDEARITAARAALELGVSTEEFLAVLREQASKKDSSLNGTLSALIADQPAQISRDQWTKVFAEACVLVDNSRKARKDKPQGSDP